MKLTVAKIQALKPRQKQYRIADGKGLELIVKPNGSKVWVYRFRFAGVPKNAGIGSFPTVSLKEAREAHQEMHALLRSGVNPIEHRRAQKLALKQAFEHTFKGVAEDWMTHHRNEQAEVTRMKDRWLLRYAFDAFGSKPVAAVTPSDLRNMLAPIRDAKKLPTAHRVLQRCSAVFKHAIRSGLREGNPTDIIEGWLPAQVVRSHPAITEPEAIGRLLRAIDKYSGQPTTLAALKLSALTFVRPGELRAARWDEFDLDDALWTIPGHRMKGEHRTKEQRPDHVVPLASQAVAILRELHALTGRRVLVFPSLTDPKQPMSENTMTTALRSMGFGGDTMTAHGFRSMASTRLNEEGFDPDVIERQLGHQEKDAVRAAYHRAGYIEQRKQMMQWWADYLDRLRVGGSVTDLAQARPRFRSVG